MENLEKETKFILQKYNIKANKNLGQNFLIDENIINNMINGSNVDKNDLIIEIGPGLGTLTKYLLEKAYKVIVIELDRNMVDILKERFFLYENLEIINDDILNIDLQKIIDENLRSFENIKSVKVISNLPYYITTPIIMKLIEDNINLESITVMIQKEVPERLIAEPGSKSSGAITYKVNYYYIGERIIEVPESSFIPQPEVTSEVIRLKKRKEKPVLVAKEELFFDIIKKAFLQRRKTLLNALINGKVFINKEQGIKILKEIGLKENVRAEELTLQNFADITNLI